MIRELVIAVALLSASMPAWAQDLPSPMRTVRLKEAPNIPDLPVYGNIGKYVAIMEFVGCPTSPGFTITFLTTDDTSFVVAWYANMLRMAGWTRTTKDGADVVSARKKNQIVIITATKSPDKKFRSSVYINYRYFNTEKR